MAKNYDSFLEMILIDYRWIFVCFFLLPLSFFYNLIYHIRNAIIFSINSAPNNHDVKVKNIQKQVLNWRKSGMKTPMCTARPGWQTMSFRKPLYKKTMYQVDCNLIDILEVDTERKIIRVEPLANIGQISSTLLKLGWTLAILPELEDLTIGGLIMGTGVESNSHKYGLFQHICVSYELVLADGTIIKCSRTKNSDLFYAIPWSHGTLGFLTAAEIKIIPATKYIRVKYQPIRGVENIVRQFEQESKNQINQFVEALQFSLNEAVVMTGEMVNDSDVDYGKINRIGKWHKTWFFEHVRSMLRSNEDVIEFIPLRDYYHRHSRSIFWELQDIVPFGNHLIFRWLFGWMMPIKVSLLKLTQTNAIKKLYEKNHIIQDLIVPITSMKHCLQTVDAAVRVYPLWLCPTIIPNDPGLLRSASNNTNELFLDIGIYGVPKSDNYQAERTTRLLEDLVTDCNGFQMLYADTYRTRSEFRKMFDHRLYDRMRMKLNCGNAFPEVYDKVNKNVRE